MIIWTSPCWVLPYFLFYPVPASHTVRQRILIFDVSIKRFIRVLIPFYITYISYFIYKVINDRFFYILFPAGNIRMEIIFTFFGMDEWISQHGIHTFSLGIGEWFLGALLLLYLLFPLLRFLMKKNSRLFFVGSTCIYLLLLFYFHRYHTPLFVTSKKFCTIPVLYHKITARYIHFENIPYRYFTLFYRTAPWRKLFCMAV